MASVTSDSATKPIGFRMRHTMLPVGDIERSVTFYTRLLGMTILRRRSDPAGRRSFAYVGYGEEAHTTVLELIATEGQVAEHWAGHIAIAVSDLRALCAHLETGGVKFAMPLKAIENGTSRYQANIYDPDGFLIELNELVE